MRNYKIVVFINVFLISLAFAQVKYQPPEGGWTYQYDGEDEIPDAFAALDGLWDHENGSDAWDGTAIGEGNPGGIKVMKDTVGGYETTFLRIQDTGNPTKYAIADPSNRKVFFGYNISTNDQIANDVTLMDDGITISFRARVAVPKGDDIDDWYPDAGTGIVPWPETGDGYLLHNNGKGNFLVHQGNGETISFCLATTTDHLYLETTMQEGLIMNRAVGNTINGGASGNTVDWDGQIIDETNAETVNLLPLDPREWHEFWITIAGVPSENGTHLVNIYKDGELQTTEFEVTAGDGTDYSGVAYLALGAGGTGQSGCYDIDFFAYKPGIIEPTSSSAVEHKTTNLPNEYLLSQNYPNPFNPATKIDFTLEKSGFVSLKIFDVLGREVATLVEGKKSAAHYSVDFYAENLRSGIYFYELRVDNKSISTKKMILMK